MFSRIRANLTTIAVAAVVAGAIASAPAIAHGVQHALFAHDAGKLGGKAPRKYMKTVGGVRLSAVVINNDDGGIDSKIGPVQSVVREGEGRYEVNFKRPIRGLIGVDNNFIAQVNAINASGNVCVWEKVGSDGIIVGCRDHSDAYVDGQFVLQVYEPSG